MVEHVGNSKIHKEQFCVIGINLNHNRMIIFFALISILLHSLPVQGKCQIHEIRQKSSEPHCPYERFYILRMKQDKWAELETVCMPT